MIAPAALDPYAATAQAILRQLPRDRSQVLLFTSAADGQGKTMTLARLAPWLAQGMEGNVLVVDANFRNPDLARWLAVAPAWRLPDVLAGTADWSAAVQATAERCVSLLPGGSDAQGRGAGRNVQGMSRLLRDLAGHYDLVVVDAPSSRTAARFNLPPSATARIWSRGWATEVRGCCARPPRSSKPTAAGCWAAWRLTPSRVASSAAKTHPKPVRMVGLRCARRQPTPFDAP